MTQTPVQAAVVGVAGGGQLATALRVRLGRRVDLARVSDSRITNQQRPQRRAALLEQRRCDGPDADETEGSGEPDHHPPRRDPRREKGAHLRTADNPSGQE